MNLETPVEIEAKLDSSAHDSEVAERWAIQIADQLRALQRERSLGLQDVESNRIALDDSIEGGKDLGTFVVGLVRLVASAVSIRQILAFLWSRVRGQQITFKLKVGTRSLELRVNNQAELENAIRLAEAFARNN